MSLWHGLQDVCRSNRRSRAPARRPQGFTLLEILVALIVMALAGGALIESFSLGLRGVEAAARHQTALAYAQSYLERIGNDLPLREGTFFGELDSGIEWQASIHAHPLPEGRSRNRLRMRAYMVEVVVSGDRAGSVKLETLRLTSERTR